MFKSNNCFLNWMKRGASVNVLMLIILAIVVAVVVFLMIYGVKNSVLQ